MKRLFYYSTIFIFLFLGTSVFAQQTIIEHDSDVTSLSPHLVLIETGINDFSRLWFQDASDPAVRWAFLARPGHPTDKDIAMAYNGIPKWRLNDQGVMSINDAYSFPNSSGVASQTLVLNDTDELEFSYLEILSNEDSTAFMRITNGSDLLFRADDSTVVYMSDQVVTISTTLQIGEPGEGTINIGGSSLSRSPSGELVVSTDFRPVGNGIRDLGTLSNRWQRVFAANGVIQTSDVRMKKNIQDIPYGLATVLSLKPKIYHWNDDSAQDKKHLGLIAQDLLRAMPEVVHEDEEIDHLGVNYAEIIPVLIKAIQEQQEQIDAQSEQIKQLKRVACKSK